MSTLLLQGGTVIDGTGAPPAPGDVLVVGDRIAAVGEGAAVDATRRGDADVVDVTGFTVMPGLIDAHVHSTLGEPASNDELFHHREPATAAILAAYNVGKVLRAGVTSFLDPDGLFGIGPGLRDCIEAGVVEGPTMKTGLHALLTSVGGTAGRMIPDEGTAGYARVVRSPDEMVRTVRSQVKDGADVIKIHATGSVPSRTGELLVWTLDELRLVCDTAHDLGAWVLAHCRSAESTLAAARAGVDIILHGSFLDEACVEAMVEAGSALCPTFTFLANLADFGAKAGSSSAAATWFALEIERSAGQIRAAYDAGVPLLCGSESGFSVTPYGEWHARELELFVRYLGLTPLEAISCATRDGAIALRQEGEVGTVQPGQRADLLVVDGDPARDVSVLGDKRNLKAVICRGRRIDLTPVPPRRPLRGEQSMTWTSVPLTWDLAHP